LPLQIGWNLSLKAIDAFFERQETSGYKFDVDSKGNAFIVEMGKAVRFSVIGLLQDYFKVPNGGNFNNPPINVVANAGKRNSYG
jgi:hypothetical protein